MPEYSLEYTLEDLPNLLMLPVEGNQVGGGLFYCSEKVSRCFCNALKIVHV